MTVTLQLQLNGKTLDLLDYKTNGFKIQTFDPGSPAVRESVSALPSQDGQFDQTVFFGPRVVAMTAVVIPSSAGTTTAAFDALGPYLAPSARPVLLYSTASDAPLRQLTLRVSQFSNPAINPSYSAASFQWVASDPIALSPTVNELDIGTGQDGGRTYALTYPRIYPAGSAGDNIGTLTVGGNFQTWPLFRIFGPITNPIIEYLDGVTFAATGVQIAFTGLTIAAGDYLEVDTKTKTVLLNSDPGANRFNFVDFPNTVFGPLQTGPAAVRFTGTTTTTSTELEVIWQNAYLQ